MRSAKVEKELAKRVEEAEDIQISSKANLLSEQKYKLAYPLFQQMMLKSCESIFNCMRREDVITNGQLKLLASHLLEKVINKVSNCFGAVSIFKSRTRDSTPYRVGWSVGTLADKKKFLNFERFLHHGPCPTICNCIAA